MRARTVKMHEGTQARKAREHVKHVSTWGTKTRDAPNLAHTWKMYIETVMNHIMKIY